MRPLLSLYFLLYNVLLTTIYQHALSAGSYNNYYFLNVTKYTNIYAKKKHKQQTSYINIYKKKN